MSYGFEVYNSNGELLADNTSYPLIKHLSGSVVTDTNSNATITYSDLGVRPAVYVKTPGGTTFLTMGSLSNTQAVIRAFASTSPYGALGSGVTIEYMLAYPISVIPNPGGDWGLQLFDASGVCTFDSRVNLLSVNSGVNVNSGASVTLPSGVTSAYYFHLTSTMLATGILNGNLYHHISRISGTVFTVAQRTLSSGIPSFGNWFPVVSTTFSQG